MNQLSKSKTYDLEERTLKFALAIRKYCRTFDKKDAVVWGDINQVLRSSGSIGANYIEANESLSRKDFFMRIKICRKESKETIYWLRLLQKENEKLIDEATQLMKIFGSILESNKKN